MSASVQGPLPWVPHNCSSPLPISANLPSYLSYTAYAPLACSMYRLHHLAGAGLGS